MRILFQGCEKKWSGVFALSLLLSISLFSQWVNGSLGLSGGGCHNGWLMRYSIVKSKESYDKAKESYGENHRTYFYYLPGFGKRQYAFWSCKKPCTKCCSYGIGLYYKGPCLRYCIDGFYAWCRPFNYRIDNKKWWGDNKRRNKQLEKDGGRSNTLLTSFFKRIGEKTLLCHQQLNRPCCFKPDGSWTEKNCSTCTEDKPCGTYPDCAAKVDCPGGGEACTLAECPGKTSYPGFNIGNLILGNLPKTAHQSLPPNTRVPLNQAGAVVHGALRVYVESFDDFKVCDKQGQCYKVCYSDGTNCPTREKK